MRQTMIIGTLLVLGAIAATGCMAPENSCDLKTQGIKVELAAMEEGGSATGQAELFTDEGVAIVLGDCGDTITVNDVELQAVDESASPVVYSASIDVADEYVFVFSRPDEDPYTSTVSGLRPEVTVTAPNGEDMPRDQVLDITWTNNDTGEIDLSITGDCLYEYDETLIDDGAETLEAAALSATDDTASCVAELVLNRSVDGTLDSSLQGWIEGWSVGRTSFNSIQTAP